MKAKFTCPPSWAVKGVVDEVLAAGIGAVTTGGWWW